MKTFEKVLEIFREYLDCDLEEEVLPCREGYLRVTWNGDSRYCVDGLLSRTPDELFEVLLSDYRSYEELRLGTSVFIMTFTAFTGSVSHFAIGGAPDVLALVFCVASTLLWARIAARYANRATPATLNRATGIVLVLLGITVLGVNLLT